MYITTNPSKSKNEKAVFMARHVNLLSMSNDDKGTDFYAYYLIL